MNSQESFNDISKWVKKIRELQHNRDFSSMAPNSISDYLTSGKIESNLTLGNELVIGRMFNYAYEDEVAIPATASIGMVNYSKLDVPTPPNFEKIKSDFSALTKLLSVVIRLVNTAFVVVVLGWNCQRFRRLNQYHSGIGLFFKSFIRFVIWSTPLPSKSRHCLP